MNSNLPIIPKPVKINIFDGYYELNFATKIRYGSKSGSLANVLKHNISYLTRYELKLIENHTTSNNISKDITLNIVDNVQNKHPEYYNLQINPTQIKLSAFTSKGLFHGIQTFKQILISCRSGIKDVLKLPCLEIEDFPRFEWRGFMLDEARHFFGKDIVKRLLDKLAILKFNKFHWHLTDDQGWRIEIKKYPKLTEIGSKRRGTYISRRNFDQPPVNGYYTQEDIKEIVNYALERYIDIIPEFDVPGHTSAAIAAYPELSCLGQKIEVCTKFGIIEDVFCIGNSKVFEFTKDVLTEFIELFPSKFLHIGGDEVPRKRWKACDKCQSFLKSTGLKSEDDLQHFFTNEISNFLSEDNVVPIGWNEVVNENLVKNTLIQYWTHNFDLVLEEIKRNRKVIMSEMSALYLNFPETKIPLEKTYTYDPIPDNLDSEYHANIVGLEACLWTEYVKKESDIWEKIIPRIYAVSEIGWSPKEKKDFTDFKFRISKLTE